MALTGNAGEELSSKILDLTVRERDEAIALKKVKDTLAQQIHDDADMSPVVEGVSEVNAAIPVLVVVGFESG